MATSTIQAILEVPGQRFPTTTEIGLRTKTIKMEADKIIGRIISSGNGPTLGTIQKVGAEFKIPVIAIVRPTITTI